MKSLGQYIKDTTDNRKSITEGWNQSQYKHRFGIFLKNGKKAEELDENTMASFRTCYDDGKEKLIVDIYEGTNYVGYIQLY